MFTISFELATSVLPMIINENDVTATMADSNALPDSRVISIANCESQVIEVEDERPKSLRVQSGRRPPLLCILVGSSLVIGRCGT